jgi:hypothetical protein
MKKSNNPRVKHFMSSSYSVFSSDAHDYICKLTKPSQKLLAYEILLPKSYGLNGGWTKEWFCKLFDIEVRRFSRATKELFDVGILAIHDGYIFFNPNLGYRGTKYWHYRCECWEKGVAFLEKDRNNLAEVCKNGNLKGFIKPPEGDTLSEMVEYEYDDD